MREIKKIIIATLSILLFISVPITVEAKVNTKAISNGTFLQLSEQDKQDTMEHLTRTVINDLGLTRDVVIDFYDAPDWYEIASNTSLEFTKWDTIRYNMANFHDTKEADYNGESMEHFVISVIAHEVRHTYQLVHMYDDSTYGKLVYSARNNYQGSYSGNYGAYYSNFIEVDARSYGSVYADNYLSGKSRTVYTANNGKVFDPVFYMNTYSDVKKVIGTNTSALLNHYNTYGINEHRMANSNDINP